MHVTLSLPTKAPTQRADLCDELRANGTNQAMPGVQVTKHFLFMTGSAMVECIQKGDKLHDGALVTTSDRSHQLVVSTASGLEVKRSFKSSYPPQPSMFNIASVDARSFACSALSRESPRGPLKNAGKQKHASTIPNLAPQASTCKVLSFHGTSSTKSEGMPSTEHPPTNHEQTPRGISAGGLCYDARKASRTGALSVPFRPHV